MSDRLTPILARKRAEIARRRQHLGVFDPRGADAPTFEGPDVAEALRRRAGGPLRVIAEIKHRSPSAGEIRVRGVGAVTAIALGYEAAGASAVSVLADRIGFGGSVLDVRRAARAVSIPVLFKEFVLDEIQIDVARIAGARLCLLLVRALASRALHDLVDACFARGLEPLVEAADAEELSRALDTRARVIGVNARDLRSFTLDPEQAGALVDFIPSDRVAVYMSGVTERADLERLAQGRADAVLVGSGLMSRPDPGRTLATWLGTER